MANSSIDKSHEVLKSLRQAIKDKLCWEELKPKLHETSQAQLEEEDENKCNILHYAIIAGYAEVVHYLFIKGYFIELQQPSHIPYLHLACFHGHTAIVGILLKERPADYRRELPINLYTTSIRESESKRCPDDIILTELMHFTPLDLAAAARQIRCVQLLLNFGRPPPSMLEGAVEHGSTGSVQLLLQEDDSITQTDINRAFKIALTRKLACCLKLLLDRGVQINEVLNTMNPFHVMYMYSSGYQLHHDRNAGLAECTEVLVKSGQNVNTDYPCGSYPLYSLLHSMADEIEYTPNSPPVHHMRALECLLKSGADPNLDEESLVDSKYNTDMFFSFSLGRDPNTSALSALCDLMQQSNNWDGLGLHWFTDCLKMILEYGGNTRVMNRYGDTPLHEMMKCLAMQHSSGHLQLDLSQMFKLLMRYGADPNKVSSNGVLPVNYYFTLMLCLPYSSDKAEKIFKDWCRLGILQQLLGVFHFMDRHKLCIAHRMITNQFYGATGEGILKTVANHINQEITEYVSQPRTMLFSCCLRIWETVRRQQSRVGQLPIPNGLKHVIMSIFD